MKERITGELSENNIKKYKALLKIIQHMNQNYDDWINVCFALHNFNNSKSMLNIFCDWSKVDYPNYDEDKCIQLWNSVKEDHDKKINIGTLCMEAKKADENAYKNWYFKYSKGRIITLVNEFTDINVAKYIKELRPNNYIYNGMWYKSSKEGKWISSNGDIELRSEIPTIIENKLKKLIIHYSKEMKESESKEKLEESIKKVNKCLSKINVNFIKHVIIQMESLYNNVNVKFDEKWNLLGFDDGVYDLEKLTFRKHEPNDYVSKSVGYNYSDILNVSEENYNFICNLHKQIHPNDEERKCWKSIVSTGLEGRTLEKFIIFNGSGRNGKGLEDDLIRITLGEYSGTLASSNLCSSNKNELNAGVANLAGKRFVVSQEAPANARFNNTIIKQLTGGDNIDARALYSNNTNIKLQCTLIVECNKKPKMKDDIGEAERQRIIDLHFPSTFIDDETEIDPTKNIFLANTEFKTNEFKHKYKFAEMKYLLESYSETKGKLYIPETVKARSTKYLENSNLALQFFSENL